MGIILRVNTSTHELMNAVHRSTWLDFFCIGCYNHTNMKHMVIFNDLLLTLGLLLLGKAVRRGAF